MSHIEVPPLKRPRSDHRLDYRPASTVLPIIVNKRRVASNPVQEALQAAMQNNADVGVFSGGLDKQKRKRMKQRRDGDPEIVVGPPHGTKKLLKRSFIDDDDDWVPPSMSKKPRPISEPMVVDLTITTDDDHPPPRKISSGTLAPQKPKPKVRPISKLSIPKLSRPLEKPKFIHAKYDSETDVVTLCLEDIRPVPLEILTLNTRFLRQSLGNDVNASALGINCTRQNGSKPCLTIVASPSSTMDSLEEVSAGGVIREFAEEKLVEKEVIELLSDSDALKENLPQENVPSVSTPPVSTLKNQHQKKPRGPYNKRKPRNYPTGDDVNGSSSSFKVPAPRAIPDTTEYRKTQYPRKKGREPQHGQEQQQPRKQKQTSDKDTTIPVQISPWTVKLASQHPNKALDSQSHQPSHNDSPSVRPPHSARSSLNGFHNLGSESDYFNGAVPSAKVLGKRRAISPMSISATTTTPHVPPNSANIQMTSHRSPSSSSLAHNNPYGLLNIDFNAFIDDSTTAISSAVQSSSSAAEAKISADSINTFSLSSSYHPLDTLTSLFDQAASQTEINNHIGSEMDSSRHTSATTHSSHVLAFDSQQPQSGSRSRGESFFSSDFLNDDVGFSPGHQHGDQEELQRQQYDNNTTVDGGGAWSSSLVVGNQPEDQIYAYETIDPTLLGGGEAPLGDAEFELDAEMIDVVGIEAAGSDDQVLLQGEEEGDVGHSNNDDESSSTDSSYSAAAASPPPKKIYKKKKVEEVKTVASHERKLPPRNRIKRVIPDMLSHDEFDLMLKRKKTAKKTNNTRLSVSSTNYSVLDDDSGADKSSSTSDDDESDDDENEKRTITVRKPISISQPRVSLKDPIERSVSSLTPPNVVVDKKLTASRAEKPNWPMDRVEAYCHQCRNKTFLAKMTCTDCQKKFCVRCYANRCVLSFFYLVEL
jgi:hypothetical protein